MISQFLNVLALPSVVRIRQVRNGKTLRRGACKTAKENWRKHIFMAVVSCDNLQFIHVLCFFLTGRSMVSPSSIVSSYSESWSVGNFLLHFQSPSAVHVFQVMAEGISGCSPCDKIKSSNSFGVCEQVLFPWNFLVFCSVRFYLFNGLELIGGKQLGHGRCLLKIFHFC